MVKRLVTEDGLSLSQALEAVGLAKSSWYYQSRQRSPRPLNPALVAAIEGVWIKSRGIYGYRKVHAALQPRV